MNRFFVYDPLSDEILSRHNSRESAEDDIKRLTKDHPRWELTIGTTQACENCGKCEKIPFWEKLFQVQKK